MRDNETNEVAILLKTFFIFVTALISGIAFFIVINSNAVFNRAFSGNASLSFSPEIQSTKLGYNFESQIMLMTNDDEVVGTDLKIKYDPKSLELLRVVTTAQEGTSLRTYLPQNTSYQFDESRVITQANVTGVLQFSAITADTQQGQILPPFKGAVIVAKLTFRALKEGQTTVTYVRNHPTQDTTVVGYMNPPQNILNTTNTLQVDVKN